MKISSVIIAMIFFSVVISAGQQIILYSSEINPAFIDSASYNSFNSFFNQQNNVNKSVADIEATLIHKEPTLLTPVELIANSALFGVTSVGNSITYVFTMIADIPKYVGFSRELAIFIWASISILLIYVVFAILSATLYREM